MVVSGLVGAVLVPLVARVSLVEARRGGVAGLPDPSWLLEGAAGRRWATAVDFPVCWDGVVLVEGAVSALVVVSRRGWSFGLAACCC